MSTYRLTPDGKWIRLNPDGTVWEISAEDKEKYVRGLGRQPHLYRSVYHEEKSADNHEGPPKSNIVCQSMEQPSLQDDSELLANQEPALGTDFELALPECYEAMPLRIQSDSFGAYRLVRLKEEHMAYKGQYHIFRQYIKSPSRIDLDKELNDINTWTAVEMPPRVQIGQRGGRFTIAVTKAGRYYRRYF